MPRNEHKPEVIIERISMKYEAHLEKELKSTDNKIKKIQDKLEEFSEKEKEALEVKKALLQELNTLRAWAKAKVQKTPQTKLIKKGEVNSRRRKKVVERKLIPSGKVGKAVKEFTSILAEKDEDVGESLNKTALRVLIQVTANIKGVGVYRLYNALDNTEQVRIEGAVSIYRSYIEKPQYDKRFTLRKIGIDQWVDTSRRVEVLRSLAKIGAFQNNVYRTSQDRAKVFFEENIPEEHIKDTLFEKVEEKRGKFGRIVLEDTLALEEETSIPADIISFVFNPNRGNR